MKKITLLLLATLLLAGAGCTTLRTSSEQNTTDGPHDDEIVLLNETQLDSDNDGLTDAYETDTSNTDPNNKDTDGDGYDDGTEVSEGYDPLVPATTQTIHVEDSQEQDGIEFNTDITVDVTTITNCGADESCIDEKFENCEKAKLESDAGFAAVSYEITGPVANGCNVTFMLTTNPNPALVNQPTYCTVVASSDFTGTMLNAIGDAFSGGDSCTGPLVDIVNAD